MENNYFTILWSFLQYINMNQPQVYMFPQSWPLPSPPQFSSIQFSRSVLSDSLWPHGPQHARPPCPSPAPRVYSTSQSVMPSNHLILCHPLLLLPSIFPNIRVFSNELAFCIRWPKYWSFSFSISPSNEHSGLISFRMDWISLQSKGLWRVFSNTTVQKHQFFGAQLSL